MSTREVVITPTSPGDQELTLVVRGKLGKECFLWAGSEDRGWSGFNRAQMQRLRDALIVALERRATAA